MDIKIYTHHYEGLTEDEQWAAWIGHEDDFTAESRGNLAYGNSKQDAIKNLKKDLEII